MWFSYKVKLRVLLVVLYASEVKVVMADPFLFLLSLRFGNRRFEDNWIQFALIVAFASEKLVKLTA